MLLQLLESCVRSRNLIQGKIIHQQLLKRSLTLNNPTVLEELTHLYASCNEVELARGVFDEIPQPISNPTTWDLLIRAYASNGPLEKALDLYYRMLDSGVRPTKFTFPFALKACAGLRAIEDGKLIHSHVKGSDFCADMYVCTALVDFYAKCGELGMAMEVFDEMPQRDIVAWNTLISGFSFHGCYSNAIGQVLNMQSRDGLRPNSSTIVGLFRALGVAGALREGKAVHGYCTRMDFNSDLAVKTGILDTYAKCKCIVYARRVFDADCLKNEVTWSAMIGGYVESDMVREAGELFSQMLVDTDVAVLTPVAVGLILRGCARFADLTGGRCVHCCAIKTGFVQDLTVGNTIVSLYAKCGVLGDAVRYFGEIGLKDIVSYNAIISGCAENCRAEESLRFFRDMKSSGIQLDSATMLSVLPACSHLAALEHGSCCHGYCIAHGFTVNVAICNALIDMYSKCGELYMAREVFDRMHKRDIVSWNTMIFGYGIHGLGKEALVLFDSMQVIGSNPDDVTFLVLLSACSHAGLVDEGKLLFSSMTQDFSIIPRIDHYICMTDLLARAGNLNETYNFIKKMPFEPDIRVWGALLAACRAYKNVELGDEVSKKIENLGHQETGSFVLLCNAYSAAERWEHAANIRITQKKKGFDKTPGCSWVEVNGVIRAFVHGDKSHIQTEQVGK